MMNIIRIHRIVFIWIIALVAINVFFMETKTARAEDQDLISKKELQHNKADEIRRHAQNNASSNLDYDNIISHEKFYRAELEYLGFQINRLGEMIRQLSERATPQDNIKTDEFIPDTPPLWIGPKTEGIVFTNPLSQKIKSNPYGPQGPTVKSVRILLEYRLLLESNPRLKLGDIEENNDVITAHILTVDDSIVQTYKIDKKTGSWEVVYK